MISLIEIGVLLKDITRITENLLQSQSKRRSTVFDEIMAPMFEKLIEIHTNYYNIFTDFRDAMPERVGANEYKYKFGISYSSIEEARNDADYIEAISKFLEERKKNEFIRHWFRNDANSLLQATTEKRERRFIFTVINYFMEDGIVETALSLNRLFNGVTVEGFIDDTIKEVIKEGGIRYYESPSLHLVAFIKKSDDPRVHIEEFLGAMTTKFFLSSDQFMKLKYAIKA